jgi:hypothetical protein
MINNNKGSVLSIAVVIVFVLSFALTTTAAYTVNVAERTNTVVESNDEDLFARTIVRSVMQELKEFIYNYPLQQYDQFFFEDQVIRDQLNVEYNLIIEEYYLAQGITLETNALTITIEDSGEFISGTEFYTRQYTVNYIKQNGSSIFKELLVELRSEDEFETIGGITYEDISDLSTYLSDVYLTEEDELDCAGDCTDAFYDSFYGSSNQNIHGALTGNVLIESDITIGHTTSVGGNSTRLDLNDNVMVVNGDLDLSRVHNIFDGIIVVNGDLTFDNRHGLELDNVIILVSGRTIIDFSDGRGNGNRRIEGDNYHILSADTYYGLINVVSGGSSFYTYIFTDTSGTVPTDYRYIGTDNNFEGFDFIIHEFSQHFGTDGIEGFTNIFEFIESSFQEE